MRLLHALAAAAPGRAAVASSKLLPAFSLALLAGCAQGTEAESDIESAAQGIYSPTNQTQSSLSFACSEGHAVTVKGPDGAVLPAGAKVTGQGVRDVVIENGVVKVTYELMDQYGALPPTRELGAHMLYRRTGDASSEYRRALSTGYGDWTVYAAPFKQGAAEAHVLTSTDDVVEVAFVFQHALDFPGYGNPLGYTPSWWQGPGPCTLTNGCACYLSGCGVIERDHSGAAIRVAPYCDQSACYKRIYSTTFVKTIRVERCAEGYFVGYHSDPSLSPQNGLAGNNESGYGEREFGTGGGNAVTWSSAGNVFRHPGMAQHGWLGLDDPTYVGMPAGQYPGFPAEQTTGPWWVADLPYYNRPNETPFVRYILFEHRLETGVWSFATPQLGATVVHFVNDEIEANGLPTRYQLFLGAMPYVSDDESSCQIPGLTGLWRCYPSEPKESTTAAIEGRVPLSWPN